MKNKNTFKDFLMDYFTEKIAEGILDDDLPDAFEKWAVELQFDDICGYADLYGIKCDLDGYRQACECIVKRQIKRN